MGPLRFGGPPGGDSGSFLRSPPCIVHLAGWKSDTYTLAMSGWSVSMAQDVYRDRIRLGLKHEGMGVIAYGEDITFDYRQYAAGHPELPLFVIDKFQARTTSVTVYGGGNPYADFNPVNCTPSLAMNSEVRRLEDMILFSHAQPAEKAIIVEEKDVLTLLEDIKRIQAPKQAELREKLRRADATQARQAVHHANIISITKAA